MKKSRTKIAIFLILQFMNILYSINSVLIKCVSIRWEREGLLSVYTVSMLLFAVLILVVYAVLWQKVLTKVDLTVAYMCKGMIIFWGMLWAFLFFCEHISFYNILGTVFIFVGTYLVTINE